MTQQATLTAVQDGTAEDWQIIGVAHRLWQAGQSHASDFKNPRTCVY